MKKVAKEWGETWRKTQVDYDRDIHAMISSPDEHEFLKLLGRYIKKECWVLEAGCGYGHKCVYFSRYLGANVIGIDLVKEPLKTLNNYLKTHSNLRVFAVVGDVTKLPFREEVFDIVTSFGVIEHFRSEREVIESLVESRRVLKTKGCLILCIPNFAATFRNKMIIALSRGRFGMYHRPLTKSSLLRFFSPGWKMVEEGYLPYGFKNIILEMIGKHSVEKTIYFYTI